jgi:hypothetical protein
MCTCGSLICPSCCSLFSNSSFGEVFLHNNNVQDAGDIMNYANLALYQVVPPSAATTSPLPPEGDITSMHHIYGGAGNANYIQLPLEDAVGHRCYQPELILDPTSMKTASNLPTSPPSFPVHSGDVSSILLVPSHLRGVYIP